MCGKLLYYRDLGFLAPVAQLDRVADFESEGCRFESCRARYLTSVVAKTYVWQPSCISGFLGACVSFASVSPLTRQNTVDGFVGCDHIIWPHSKVVLSCCVDVRVASQLLHNLNWKRLCPIGYCRATKVVQ